MNELQDTLTNWTNSLGNTYSARFVAACTDCEGCKKRGFTRDEASEILASRGYGMDGVSDVLDQIYGPKTAEASTKNIDLFVVPTKYKDISKMIEYRLAKSGPEKFVSYLTECEMPIIGTTERHKKSLLKIAQCSIEDPSTIVHLHDELEPYVEEAMLNSVLMAEQHQATINKLSQNQYLVEFPARCATVDLGKGESNSSKFVKGNFGKFGLADEFLIKAHDTVSPYIRLRKSLIHR